MSLVHRFAIVAALALGATTANAATIDAFGSGWILSNGLDNSGGGFGNGIANHFAGYDGDQYNNFFEFSVPTGTVTSATLSIWNAANNTTIDPDAVYNFFAASNFSFSGLVGGPSFGSVTLGVADTGTSHYVNLSLNSAGLAYLNSVAGGIARFGGTTTSVVDPQSCTDCIAIFGYTGGNPVAQLALGGAVPEPASWAMLIAGFGLTGAALRRRRAFAAVA